MAVATRMTVDEIGLALAIYCKLHDENPRVARKHLDPTPCAHFDEASQWAESNAKVIKLVGSDREAIEARSYSLNQARGWFSRLIGIGRSRGASAPDDDEIERVMEDLAHKGRSVDEKKARELAKLRELVDESFDSA